MVQLVDGGFHGDAAWWAMGVVLRHRGAEPRSLAL